MKEIYDITDTVKICAFCETTKDIDCFRRVKYKTRWMDEQSKFCIQCENSYSNIYKTFYKKTHKKEVREANKIYREKPEVKEKRKQYWQIKNNEPKTKQRYKKWVEKNKQHINEYKNRWIKEKYKNDLTFRLHCIIVSGLRDSLFSNSIVKDRHCFEILGYSLEQLKEHLEKQFEPWMTWENHR